MSYKHLSLTKRQDIEVERKLGKSCKKNACDLGRSASTISREVKRNTGLRGYRHQQAERLARKHHQNKPKSLKLILEIRFIIDACLHAYWSPEQIAGHLKDMEIISLHHETIYQYILTDKRQGGDMVSHATKPAFLTAKTLINDPLKLITDHA